MDSNEIKADVLRRYAKAIVHLKTQFPDKLGLVLGAGISNHFNIPNWKNLVYNLSTDNEIAGKKILNDSPNSTLPFQTQMLFEHYRKKRYGGKTLIHNRDRKLDIIIFSELMEKIRVLLYKEVQPNFKVQLEKHPYLNSLLPIIKKTKLTVNYNFDDILEKSIFLTTERNVNKNGGNSGPEKEFSRGYESITNASLQFRSTKAIIYHPNGIIPERKMEIPSDRFIFSEHEFADQILDMLAGDFSTLLDHFSKNTCLFIGLSLDDQTLRNLLRQTARSNPGHYHYYVKYISKRTNLTRNSKSAIKLANFKVYNLITLFLNDSEISALGDLINENNNDFVDFAEINGAKIKYPFYLTGPLGVGKSTSINYFRNIVTYDEWIEPRPEILSKPWQELSEEERTKADNWIMSQFRLKNDNIRHKPYGLILLDRGPLDPLAFTIEKDWSDKANSLLQTICPGECGWMVQPGCVILLTGDYDELALRMTLTGRTGYNANRLQEMEKSLKKAYNDECIKIINTKNLTISEVVKRIAEIIHLSDYEFTDLHKRLLKIENNVDVDKCRLIKE